MSESLARVSFTVNGAPYDLDLPPRRLLSDALRHDVRLTGTHVGCEHGVCGACTVLVDGAPMRSCLLFAVSLDGAAITTIEGLRAPDGGMGPVQQAFHECHALQCGFCTPGFVTTVAAYLRDHPTPTREEAREAIAGNLCRCTGYVNIVDAVERAAELLSGSSGSAEAASAGAAPGLPEDAAAPKPSGASRLPPDPSTVAAASSVRPGTPAVSAGRAGVPFYVMKSNGGVLSAEEVVDQPITTVLSGPAAGALGAAVVAEAAGFPQVVTCDGGGTSTDVTVVIDGQPALTTEGNVGAYPSKIPMIDVVTVGAGGGSIAWISPEGTLKVGPQSAGADPGPICYGQGGSEPTITDAHVLLGRIPPHLLGGEVPLDVDLAAAGMDALAGKLGLSRERCATGVLEISAWNQANALRQVTVKRGLDVRDFTMVTFGGSGSLLACRLVDILGLDGVLVPLNPGNLSAYGLLTVDVRNDYVQTAVAKASVLDLAAVQEVYDGLATRADAALEREGFAAEERVFLRTADVRYFGQAYEVRVDVPDGPVTSGLAATVADAFHDEHRALYGYDFRHDARQEVEWVNLRVTGVGPIRKPALRQVAPGQGAEAARTGTRRVYFDEWVDAVVLDRARLGAGDVVEGPAVLEEFSSTVPLHPGFTARVDGYGNLVIRRSAS
jgi:N-methylhydantoinase A/oxoprolinase/acetone carboxylase beta subunit/aerobic-type carbon monoxide dehydrogenase small subunit (CoxS/CutS family)